MNNEIENIASSITQVANSVNPSDCGFYKISISTKHVIKICKDVIDALKDFDVKIFNTDLSTLVLVTLLQIEAKISCFSYNEKTNLRALRTKDDLKEAIFPLAFYIAQIGKFEIDEQYFEPEIIDLKYDNVSNYVMDLGLSLEIPSDVIFLNKGNYLTNFKQWVRVLNETRALESGIIFRNGNCLNLTEEFIENSDNFNWIGILSFEPAQEIIPKYRELCERYKNFSHRVETIAAYIFERVDYEQAKGTAMQLVTSEFEDSDSTLLRLWSNRLVDDNTLKIGGQLRYGFQLEYRALRIYDARYCETFIDAPDSDRHFVFSIRTHLANICRRNLDLNTLYTPFQIIPLSSRVPRQELYISTIYIIDICKALINKLEESYKVKILDTDLSTLVLVTLLQIETKLWIAWKLYGGYSNGFDELDYKRLKETEVKLKEAIFPLSFYIAQIGKVEIDGQIIVPTIMDLRYDNITNYTKDLGISSLKDILPEIILLSEGILTDKKQWCIVDEAKALKNGIVEQLGDNIRFTNKFLANPNNFNWIGCVYFRPYQEVVPKYQKLLDRYGNFMKRVNQRMMNAFVNVDYKNANGTVAQLVTSKFKEKDSEIMSLWSHRTVNLAFLKIGGLLRYGFKLENYGSLRSYNDRCCEGFVDAANVFRRFIFSIDTHVKSLTNYEYLFNLDE